MKSPLSEKGYAAAKILLNSSMASLRLTQDQLAHRA